MAHLDEMDWQLLALLQEDARLGYRELARRVGLTPPAVATRVRRLESTGVIAGYHARVDPMKAGYGVEAFIHVASTGRRQSYTIAAHAAGDPLVLEDHRVAGQNDHVIRMVGTSISALEPFIDKLNENGRPTTSFVFSSPKRWSPVADPGPGHS